MCDIHTHVLDKWSAVFSLLPQSQYWVQNVGIWHCFNQLQEYSRQAAGHKVGPDVKVMQFYMHTHLVDLMRGSISSNQRMFCSSPFMAGV